MSDTKIPHPVIHLRRDLWERAIWLRTAAEKGRKAKEPVRMLPSDLDKVALLIEMMLAVTPNPNALEREDD